MSALLLVNEIFETIQGEGAHSGTPAVFIRLQGCPVGCPWCDTKHTWQHGTSDERSSAKILEKTVSAPTWAAFKTEQLLDVVTTLRPRHVVITGGEPCLYDLETLTVALIEGAGRRVQIETSGTQPVRVDRRTWVTVSPKISMPGGFSVRPDALARANEIKMPVGRTDDIENLLALLAAGHHQPGVPVFLQPLSTLRKATELCIAAASAHDFRISVQLHALLGWR